MAPMTRNWQWTGAAALFALLILTLVIYWPGLAGPLILDDFPNLNRLRLMGPISDAEDFFRFIFSSSTYYPVRPLSFASFLINDIDWPLYVPAHKYTGLMVHLINGALVFWLSLLVCRTTRRTSHETVCIALSTTALWMLAPLQVSTVLYVIQRMTSLSALFVLCGLISYCYGRLRLNTRPVAAHVQMTTGVAVFGMLGVLSKESAVLLPLYILAVEHTLLKSHIPIRDIQTKRWFHTWQWVFLAAPVILVFTYLISRGTGYGSRAFTAFERMTSQPRILLDYLQDLLIPMRQGMGVTHDDYVLSSGLLSPPMTLFAITVLIAALVAAFWLLREGPTLFGFAVLWFLAGHLLESSFIALEPYFEHRNYLPAFGPFFALSFFVWTNRLQLARYLKIGLVVYLVGFIVITKQNVDIWSSKILMGEIWAREHPHSVRAQQIRADVWSRAGRGSNAHEILQNIADARPGVMASQLQQLLSGCRADPDNVEQYLDKAIARINNAHFDFAVLPTLITLKDTYRERCPKLTSDLMLDLIDTILRQPSVEKRSAAVRDLLYVRATVLAAAGELKNAVAHLYAAFHRRPNYDLGLTAVEYLYNLGWYPDALRALEDVEAIELQPWHSDNFRSKEIEHWRDKIRARLEPGPSEQN
jgi:protein O-mannosyl-transferase